MALAANGTYSNQHVVHNQFRALFQFLPVKSQPIYLHGFCLAVWFM